MRHTGYSPIFWSFIVAVLFFVNQKVQADSQEGLIDRSRLIVKLHSALQPSDFVATQSMVLALSTQVGVAMQPVRTMTDGAQVLKVPPGTDVDALAQQLSQQPAVDYAVPDLIMRTMMAPNDPMYADQWHYFEPKVGINLPEAWELSQGHGVVVAIVDTGIVEHADLNDNVLAGYDFINDRAVANDGDGRDASPLDVGDWLTAGECGSNYPPRDRQSSWHGSHVAGTIAAVSNNELGVAGIAWGTKILPLRALGKCGGYSSDIIDAMRWAVGIRVPGVPSNRHPAKVINLSLGGLGTCNRAYQSAINDVRAKGAVVVVAAGNEEVDVSLAAPANCSGIITVAATNREGGLADYSNYGSGVDVSAPGGEGRSTHAVLSTANTGEKSPGKDTYLYYQGTSMATPHVAGVAALMASVNANLKADDIENILERTAQPFPSAVVRACTTARCGKGIIDAGKAVRMAMTYQGGTPSPSLILLQNGVAKGSLEIEQGQILQLAIPVAMDSKTLTISISGGHGDADMYVRKGQSVSREDFDWKSEQLGNVDKVVVNSPTAGLYYIGLYAYEAFSDVTVLATYDGQDSGNQPSSGSRLENGKPIGNVEESKGKSRTFTLTLPENARNLSVTLKGGIGDADLYLKKGEGVSPIDYDHHSQNVDTNESIRIEHPAAGTYSVLVYAFTDIRGASIEARYEGTSQSPGDERVFENNQAMLIPDNMPSGIESTISVSGVGAATSMSATVDIQHSYKGDLKVVLISPNHQEFVLQAASGEVGADLIRTYPVEIAGLDLNGVWTLRVIDTSWLDKGRLRRWSMRAR